ncbi:hypothetical protein [Nostoc sp. FACHB-892]|nr:hypothetical protein [Nostoc sp. FACHB-892]
MPFIQKLKLRLAGYDYNCNRTPNWRSPTIELPKPIKQIAAKI